MVVTKTMAYKGNSTKSKEKDGEKKKNPTLTAFKVILAIVALSSLPYIMYNPDISLGPLDTLRKEFFKTEIILSGNTYTPDGLLKAIRNDDTRMVKLFVRSEMNLNLLGTSGVSPLCVAASTGKLDMVNILLKGDVNLVRKNSSDGLTPVFCAIEGNNIAILDKLRDAGLILSTRNDRSDGISPLHYAAALGRDNMASYFLKNGADVNVRDVDGQTPLHKAILQDNIVVLYVLLNAGADANAEDFYGNTPKTIAQEQGKDVYTALLNRF